MRALSAFSQLEFQYPFRVYQQMILDQVESSAGDHKIHLVAPPGSGKTIVGLELIRRFGRPAVVFAPTTTIQKQWQEKVDLFASDPTWTSVHTSMDPTHLVEINLLTYQVLSTPGEQLEFVQQVAEQRWVDDLLTSDQAHTEAAARQRIETLQESNPAAYRREISRRYRRIKRQLLQKGEANGRQFLHRNAIDLIDRIAALGVGTLVLDECHHLLDYWAFILRELIHALPEVRVVGLTATLPDPQNESEYENYSSLLGDVDFMVPTPAVVKEGNLAPYRDLVYFCRPSDRENEYLDAIQDHFEEAVARITETAAFWEWIRELVPLREMRMGPLEPFAESYYQEPALITAAVKYLLARDHLLPDGFPLVGEMRQPLTIDDWLTLLETFGLRVLKVSADSAFQALFRELKKALLPFGVTISESGIRHQRSPGDLVLSLSESKDQAVADILKAELGALGSHLRAVVLTDFERLSARSRRLQGILDPDAGSAVRVYQHLVADPETNTLDPILVTGNVVLVDSDQRVTIDRWLHQWAQGSHLDVDWEWKETGSPWMMELVGRGRDWSSRTYVALVTQLFENGVTRCVVGTRGLLGEGWDALRLNTLIDLTSVTTQTGVRQIRGRGLRLDPQWTHKVSHNWDVVCVDPGYKKGNADLLRFASRHRHIWGIVAAGERAGQVVRGVAHVDLELARVLETHLWERADYLHYTQRALAAVDDRERTYELWAVGQPYSNRPLSVTQIPRPREVTFRTSRVVRRSLGGMFWRLGANLVATAAVVGASSTVVAPWMLPGLASMGVAALPLGAAGVGALALNTRAIWRLFQASFVELPVDAVLLDIGRALLAGLRDAGLVERELPADAVRLEFQAGGGLQVFLEGASPADSACFARALQELLGPLGDARYLIERDSSSLRNPLYQGVWHLARRGVGLDKQNNKAYHRVPSVLATRREHAEQLARYWRKNVGGGRLIYTRTAEGRQILLQARAERPDAIQQLAFELWR